MDAEYYQVKYEEITDKILKYHKGTSSIANEFTHKRVFINRLKKKYNYIEIGEINVSDGSYSYNEVFVEDLPANGKMKLQHGNILVSKVRPYRGAVTIIRENISDLVGSAAFTILSEKTEYKKEVLQVLLRTEYFKELMMKFNVGTSYPVIKDEDILNLPLPLIVPEVQDKIVNIVEDSFRLKTQSEHLLEVAKRAVEVAIEEGERKGVEFIEKKQN